MSRFKFRAQINTLTILAPLAVLVGMCVWGLNDARPVQSVDSNRAVPQEAARGGLELTGNLATSLAAIEDLDNSRAGSGKSQAKRLIQVTNTRFSDPAPPLVSELDAIETPQARPYARVKFHGQPKRLPTGAKTHDWVSFLGPTHNAISTETKLLKKFPPGGLKLVWEMEKGDSYSSPAIQGDRLVFPHRVGNQVVVECLHPETGEKYWEFRIPTKYEDRFGYSNGPRASPVISDDNVYIYSAEGKLFSLKLKTGQLNWMRSLQAEFNVQQDFFGSVCTPLVEGKLLIINIGAPGGPCVIGLDKLSGRMVWGAGEKWGPSYASAIPSTIHGRRRVFVFAGGDSDPPVGGLLALDPTSGAIDFEFPWRSQSYESVNASCPVVIGDQVFISATYKAGSALMKINNDFSPALVWKMKDNEHNQNADELGLHWNTAVHKAGHLYAFDGRNEPDASLVCLSLRTGRVVWREEPQWEETVTFNGQQKQTVLMSTLRGTLLRVDDRFLCLGELGHLLWLDLTPRGYKELDRSWLFFGRYTWALPVLSRGLLYVTQNSRDFIRNSPQRLLCYDLRGSLE